jgi:hypothetical protein
MSRYHDQTLQLLDIKGTLYEDRAAPLTRWATTQGISLPGAYLEWAQIDPGGIMLSTFTNTDMVEFVSPEIVVVGENLRGIKFYEELCHKFAKVLLLDSGDDPEVLFVADPAQRPEDETNNWSRKQQTKHAAHFSDCVFAQIFDHQFSRQVNLRLASQDCLAAIKDCFQEAVTTQVLAHGQLFTQYRFFKSSQERAMVLCSEKGTVFTRITADRDDHLSTMVSEVFDAVFAAGLGAPSFNSHFDAALSLLVSPRSVCTNKPSPEALARLMRANKPRLIDRYAGFPEDTSEFLWEESGLGVTIRLRQVTPGWWSIEEVTPIKTFV